MAMESGVSVVIRGFVPTDKADLKGHRAALDAVIAATESKDLTKLSALMKIESVETKPVSRREKGE